MQRRGARDGFCGTGAAALGAVLVRICTLFRKQKDTINITFGFEKCIDSTGDTLGVKCPLTTKEVSRVARSTKDLGWYIKLPNSQKVTAEPTISNGLVYYPIFEPSDSKNQCSLGLALICAVDDECGTNVSSQLGKSSSILLARS